MVRGLKEILTYVLPHFDMYPLITQKKADYLLFKEIALMMKKGEHPIFFNKKKNEKIKKINFFLFLKEAGLQQIVNIRASLNLGLSDVLKAAFPNTIPAARPLISKQEIPHLE